MKRPYKWQVSLDGINWMDASDVRDWDTFPHRREVAADDVVEVTAGESITLPLREPGPAVKVIGDGVGAPAPKTYRKETEVVAMVRDHEYDGGTTLNLSDGMSVSLFELLPREATRLTGDYGPRGRFRIVVEFEPED